MIAKISKMMTAAIKFDINLSVKNRERMIKNRHRQEFCFCKKDEKTPIIEYEEYESVETGTVRTTAHEIIFVIAGEIFFQGEGVGMQRLLKKGEFLFMPMGVSLTYRASAKSALLVMRLTENLPECHIFRVNKPLYKNKQPGLYALESTERISQFTDYIVNVVQDGMRCMLWQKSKVSEIYYLLHAYYTDEECHSLFSYITTPDMAFSEFVRLNFLRFKNVDDLAAAYNMDRQRFNTTFKKVFDTTPKKWIQRRKAILIYQDICQSGKSLKEIAHEYEFSAYQNFLRYCRLSFGKAPVTIKEEFDRIMNN